MIRRKAKPKQKANQKWGGRARKSLALAGSAGIVWDALSTELHLLGKTDEEKKAHYLQQLEDGAQNGKALNSWIEGVLPDWVFKTGIVNNPEILPKRQAEREKFEQSKAFSGDLATAKEKLAFVDDKIAKVKGTPLEASQLMTLNRMREQLTQTIAKLENDLQASQIAQALQQKADQIKAVMMPANAPRAKPLPAFEKGGVTGRGPALVGENGPEYIWTNKGQYVSNNNQLKQIRALAASAAIAMPIGLSLPQPPAQAALFTPPAVQQQGAGGSARSAPLVGELHVHVSGGGSTARSMGQDVGRETVKAIRQYHSDGGM